MNAEENCNRKTSIHSFASLEKVKSEKREQIQKCEEDFKETNDEIERLRYCMKEMKQKMKDHGLERELIEQFHTVFQGELKQSLEEAEFRRRSKWAIVKLQSAWRGTMVRKGLGKFKKLKKKRKRRKSKKKSLKK